MLEPCPRHIQPRQVSSGAAQTIWNLSPRFTPPGYPCSFLDLVLVPYHVHKHYSPTGSGVRFAGSSSLGSMGYKWESHMSHPYHPMYQRIYLHCLLSPPDPLSHSTSSSTLYRARKTEWHSLPAPLVLPYLEPTSPADLFPDNSSYDRCPGSSRSAVSPMSASLTEQGSEPHAVSLFMFPLALSPSLLSPCLSLTLCDVCM